MIRFRSSLLPVLVLAVAACSRDATFTEPVPPLAAINFVNAVSDTNTMAFRVVDIVSNAGQFGAPFRGASTYPMGIEAGARHIKVFFDTTDVVLAKTVMLDTTLPTVTIDTPASGTTLSALSTFVPAGRHINRRRRGRLVTRPSPARLAGLTGLELPFILQVILCV